MEEPSGIAVMGNVEPRPESNLEAEGSRWELPEGGGKKDSSEAGTRRIVATASVLRSKLRLGVPPPEPEPDDASLGCREVLSSGQPVCDSLGGCLFSDAPAIRPALGGSSS